MYKLSPKAKERVERLTRIRTRRHFNRKYGFDTKRRRYVEFNRIAAPRRFALTYDENNRNAVIQFIKKMAKSVLKKKKTLIDFSATERMHTCGTLLFVSELRNLINVLGRKCPVIRCNRSHNSKVMEVLQQIGVLKLLKYRKKISARANDVVNWKFTSGNSVTGEDYDRILSHVDDKITETKQKDFYVGITEAMANTHHHAYIMNKDRPVANGTESWWAFSQIKDGRLHVVFCDLGIGIPKSLPVQQPSWFQNIKQLLPSPSDSDLIKNAIEISVSRTNQSHRGKGLRQFVKVVEGVQGSFLSIHSNRGRYGIDNGNKGSYLYKNSISGTLIEWSMPIETIGEN